jgi:hypothetical protein
MKKQILNLGKGLSKAEQKRISGGTPIVPVHWDEHCAQQGETGYIEGCPCTSDMNCLTVYVSDGNGGVTLRSGTCVSGTCVAS